MNKNIINIGVPSKGRLKNDTINIFKKKKIDVLFATVKRNYIGKTIIKYGNF